MSARLALRAAFVLSLAGTPFSGTLSRRELHGPTALACPSPGAPGTLLGWPACVYGFFVFLLLTAVTGAGLLADYAIGPSGPDVRPSLGRLRVRRVLGARDTGRHDDARLPARHARSAQGGRAGARLAAARIDRTDPSFLDAGVVAEPFATR